MRSVMIITIDLTRLQTVDCRLYSGKLNDSLLFKNEVLILFENHIWKSQSKQACFDDGWIS